MYPRFLLWTEAIHEGCHGTFPMYRPIMLHELLTLLTRWAWWAAHAAHALGIVSRSHRSRVKYSEQLTLLARRAWRAEKSSLYKYTQCIYFGTSCSIISLLLNYLIIRLFFMCRLHYVNLSTHYLVTNLSKF